VVVGIRSQAGNGWEVSNSGFRRADCTRLTTMAARWPASSLPTNIDARRLCEASHKRRAWKFVGSEFPGQRAAIIMSLVQSARMNGHEPWAYLRDVLQRLPTLRNSQLDALLPHRWAPAQA
jgi:hypothetical protein